MKKIVLLTVAAMSVLAACTTKGYTINGKVTDADGNLVNGIVYLGNYDRNAPFRDTAEIVNGKFVFTGEIQFPDNFYLSIEGMDGMGDIFMENEKFTVDAKCDASNEVEWTVKGGIVQEMMNRLNEAGQTLNEKYDIENVVAVFRNRAASEEERNAAMEKYDDYMEEYNAVKDEMIESAPVSHFALSFIADEVSEMEIDEIKEVLDAYDVPEFAGNPKVERIQKYYDKEKGLQPGNQAPEFTLNDPDGNPITLSDIYKKNKVTMIDFWASWCGPCRNFNPTLVKIYKEYHKYGFEILGVSLDRDADSWKAGIKDDKLTWPHVSDLKYWQSEAAALYNVRYIPQNAFVDAEGKILARQLTEEEIVDFLKEQLLEK